MRRSNTLLKWLLPSLISLLAISLMLVFAPKIEIAKTYNFNDSKSRINFINAEDSAKIEALSLYDFKPIFLPTPLNINALAPKEINIDSFENINNVSTFQKDSYNNYVLNKKESYQTKVKNIFHSRIAELMPYYKMQDNRDFMEVKNFISISVIDTKNGEIVANEKLEIKDKYSNFFVPTEVFMSINDNLTMNIVDNTASPNLETSTTELIKDTLAKMRIFNRLNSGYYKLIISP